MKTIQQILDSINSGYSTVSDLIPNKYNFSDEADTYVNSSTDFNYFGWGNAICIQSDGKIVVGGQSGLYDGSNYYSLIKRFNVNGTVDESFTSLKFSGNNSGHIRDIKQQSSGKLIVVGHFTSVDGSTHNRIVRLNTNGTIDETFNSGTGFNSTVLYIKILSDDSILIGGIFGSYNGDSYNNMVKLDLDGNIDSTFSNNLSFNSNVYAIEEDSSGGIYVGGWFNNRIAKLNSDGTTDNGFDPGTGFNDRVNVIRIQEDGKLIVGGWFNQYNGSSCNPGVVRLNTDGTVDNSFASEGTGINNYDGYSVQDLKIQSNGKIVVGGWFVGYNDLVQGRIIRLNTNGTKDSTFVTGTGFSDRVQRIEIDSSGNIFCVGFFYTYNGKACTSQFNYMNSKCAGGVAKLSSTGSLVGTPLVHSYNSLGINDGGRDMWDGGAYFNTDLTHTYASGDINGEDSIPFTHSTLTISDSSDDYYSTYNIELDNSNYIGPMDGEVRSGVDYFGSNGEYFTNLYPGLLVLGAKDISIDEFSITGGTGQDGSGDYNNGYINLSVNGSDYVVFYKTSYGNSSFEPSINQMIILNGTDSGITQNLYDETDSDDHVLTGLSDRTELYVLVFGRLDQSASTEEELTSIANSFLSIVTTEEVVIVPCSKKICTTPSFKCFVGVEASCVCAKAKYFYPKCKRSGVIAGTCYGKSGAYVPAITVCNQRLF